MIGRGLSHGYVSSLAYRTSRAFTHLPYPCDYTSLGAANCCYQQRQYQDSRGRKVPKRVSTSDGTAADTTGEERPVNVLSDTGVLSIYYDLCFEEKFVYLY